MINWAKPDYWGKEIEYVNEALQSTWISGGRFINQLESFFNNEFQVKESLAVSNGTTALHLAYLGLDLKPTDEIIVPAFSFMAVANVACHLQVKPVFAEVDKSTWCLDPNEIEKHITHKTKAIVPVHTYGNVCDMKAILEISKQYNIPVIEDCAEAIFSKYEGQYAGTFGKINTFSFHATKTVTTGEGGLVVTNDEEIATKMKLYRSHGMTRDKIFYWHVLPGHNFRLTNFQAAMGVAQLECLEKIIEERKRVFNTYQILLSNVEGITLQYFSEKVEPVVWALGVLIDTKAFPQGRDTLIAQMNEKGIETRPGFYSAHLLPIYEVAPMPVSDHISQHIISLPFYPSLREEQIEYICNTFISLKK